MDKSYKKEQKRKKMKPQNKSNHRRFFAPYHFVILPLGLACLVMSIYGLSGENPGLKAFFGYLILTMLSFTLLLTAVFGRASALKAQDRAIRAEESLRHFILSGERINPELRLGQIIALRFASDEELLALTEKAVKEKLKNSEIKALIVNWRADRHRV